MRGSIYNPAGYEQGEWIAAGRPVVSLLPPDHIRVRFFGYISPTAEYPRR
jgi:hypothetical protein